MVEEKILEFLDGRLESYDEEELLHRLAVSPEKRGLLREHMKLREAVTHASRQETLSVPSTVTASLYRRLAYNGYNGLNLGSSVTVSRPVIQMMPAAGGAVAASTEGYKLSALLSFAVMAFLMGFGSSYLSQQEPHYISQPVQASKIIPPSPTLTNPAGAKTTTVVTKWQPVAYEERSHEVELATLEASVPEVIEASAAQPIEFQLPEMLFAETETKDPERFELTRSFATYAVAVPIGAMPMASVAEASAQKIAEVSTPSTEVNSQVQQPVEANAVPADHQPTEVASVDAMSIDDVEIEPMSAPLVPAEDGIVGTVDPKESIAALDVDFREAKTLAMLNSELDLPPMFNYISVRTSGGQLPGRDLSFTGSYSEMRFSRVLLDPFLLKVSIGEFAPYESMAKGIRKEFGITVIGTEPTLVFKSLYGLELGVQFEPLGIPLEFSAGALLDFKGGIFPRSSLLTTFELTRNFVINFGVDALVYVYDVQQSIDGQLSFFQGANPAVKSGTPRRQLSGYIGPSIEAGWRF